MAAVNGYDVRGSRPINDQFDATYRVRIDAAVSRDHGATWARDVLVYASPAGAVCECCHPSVAIGDAGDFALMFRNNLDGNRDMYVTRSADGVRFAPVTKLVRARGPSTHAPWTAVPSASTGATSSPPGGARTGSI